ncbi:histone deacetylase superfamily protein [Luminiphilus syltensis NOR5-1B]|uniref:Histone deacetylase superfamily protein n=1 Tax=Luminiphilus syltensis NOR5-1B TaxID=565045 RepID=B8KY08_9GAMM|nr:class II histone deacetylase [Luminiphilus syltensis]EED34384.1 histone deacetylase superfamily protein [Luminiphilus syltensis NOR5-1B]
MSEQKTGFVWHELYMWHNTDGHTLFLPSGIALEPYRHVENPDAKRRVKNLLDASGLSAQLKSIVPRKASFEDLTRAHTSKHVTDVKVKNEQGARDAGNLAPLGQGSYEIACLSAGGLLTALDAIKSGDIKNAYALVRPPGHHAEADLSMGFCIFNNGAVAARYAQSVLGYKKIAIIDWDVHHGNGTQAIFWDDPSVLTVSLHQDRCFPPDSGYIQDNGGGAGAGFNLNVPLPPGSGRGAYLSALERVALPAIERFKPDLIFVACGYDAGAFDPMARQMLSSDTFGEMTALVKGTASRLCEGRMLLYHEGGYHAETVPYFALRVIEELADIRTNIEDPFLMAAEALGGQDLQPHQTAMIDQATINIDAIGT